MEHCWMYRKLFLKLEIFTPEKAVLHGALAELSRYLTVGMKLGHLFEIVGGTHPVAGGFFNIELMESAHGNDSGLLKAAVRDSELMI
jgi:hypothetical protein